MLHNPLLINSISAFFKNCNSHSIHGIRHHLFFSQPCVALLHVLCGTSVLSSTVSSIPSLFFTLQQAVSVVFLCSCCSLLFSHMWMGFHTKLCICSNTTVISCCACSCAVRTASIETKSIHFIADLPVKCCSVDQPLSAEAECSDGKCCYIFELNLLNFFGNFGSQVNCLFLSANLIFFPSSPWPDPRAALSDPERPRGCFGH